MIEEHKIQQKERHIIVTAYLILAILFSIFIIIISLFPEIIYGKRLTPENKHILSITANYSIFISFIGDIIEVVCLFLLFQWKKNAFWILLITKVVMVINNFIYTIINVSLQKSFITLIESRYIFFGIMLLYIVFQIKKNGVKAWDYLD